jgi:hypothetical protein
MDTSLRWYDDKTSTVTPAKSDSASA